MKGTMKMMKALRKGQTMVEYIIIVCLIAVSLIAVFTYLSRAIGKKAAGAAEALSEEEGDKAKSAADSISEDSLKQLGED
jgi:Flp pilus assembly pilin Flp